MKQQYLKCHTDLVMECGDLSAIAGRFYPINSISGESILIIDEQGDEHFFLILTGGEGSYKNWFTITDENIC